MLRGYRLMAFLPVLTMLPQSLGKTLMLPQKSHQPF